MSVRVERENLYRKMNFKALYSERKEVMNMLTRKSLVACLVLVVVVAFTLPALAGETVKGKIEALDKEAKKITIGGTEYVLSEEASQADVAVGDEVEAIMEGGVVKNLKK